MKKVNPNIILAIIIFFVLATTSVTSASPVSANAKYSHDNWTEDLDGFWVLNECTGESILCEGLVSGSNQRVADSSGGVHCVVRYHFNLSGIGSFGNEYQVIGNFTRHVNSGNSSLPYECTVINKANLISHGKDTNMKLCIRSHVTINSNGEVTVSSSDAWIDCQGSNGI